VWGFAFFFYRREKRADVQDKYLNYRALAEGLRVHCFWRLAGLPDSVADHYLRKQKTELDWIRNCMRVLDIPRGGGDPAPSAEAEACAPAYQFVLNGWVNSQCDFFQCAAVRDQKKTHRKERLVRWLFGIGLVFTALVFTLPLAGIPLKDGTLFAQHEWLRVALILIAVLASVAAGLREAYADKMAYSDQAKQYERMRDVFRRASTLLTVSLQQETYDEAKHIIRELGKEALAENGDWVLLHRARPVDVPRGR
jgi:hypothetical protein